MDFTRQIAQMFHDEHLVTVATLERFEALLTTCRTGPPAELGEGGESARTLRDIQMLITSDVVVHFGFEESHLFPLLTEAGDGEMGALLTEEHGSILLVAEPLGELCRAICEGGASDADWRELRRLGGDFVEQMLGHIQKEEMGLLLSLDDVVDQARDGELVMEYAALR